VQVHGHVEEWSDASIPKISAENTFVAFEWQDHANTKQSVQCVSRRVLQIAREGGPKADATFI
jgi:hypothetical protein